MQGTGTLEEIKLTILCLTLLQCEECSSGFCTTTHSSSPIGGRQPCVSDDASCGGFCTGSIDGECVYLPSSPHPCFLHPNPPNNFESCSYILQIHLQMSIFVLVTTILLLSLTVMYTIAFFVAAINYIFFGLLIPSIPAWIENSKCLVMLSICL